MAIEQALRERSGNKCELSGATEDLVVYEVPPVEKNNSDKAILISRTCLEQIEDPTTMDENHWRCLNDSMWSTVPAVQVMAYRLLKRMADKGWPQELLDMMYLDDEMQAWADKDTALVDMDREPTRDSNGTQLQAGDTVHLIKDLDVKGAGFTAKRGTVVKNISLTDNPLHIEGKVNGTQVVLVAAYLKKS